MKSDIETVRGFQRCQSPLDCAATHLLIAMIPRLCDDVLKRRKLLVRHGQYPEEMLLELRREGGVCSRTSARRAADWPRLLMLLLLLLTLALAAMPFCRLLVLVSLGGGLVLAGALSGGREGCASSGDCARNTASHCFRNMSWDAGPVCKGGLTGC